MREIACRKQLPGSLRRSRAYQVAYKMHVVQISTVPYDPRFPATNQARNCYTRYNEYYKCIAEKDEDSPDCKFYQKAYRSICPSEWVRP